MDLDEKLQDEVLLNLKNKYFGIYRGVVTNVNDPLKLGRVRAKVHELFGEKDESNWASYCTPFGGGGSGFYFMPSVVTKNANQLQAGDGIWLMFEAGDINRPVWVGYWYSQVDPKPASASETIRVIQSKSGHQIIFDDSKGQESICIKDKGAQSITLHSQSNSIEIIGNEKVIVQAPEVEVGAGSKLSGIVTHRTHPICQVTGLPIGHSLTVQGES